MLYKDEIRVIFLKAYYKRYTHLQCFKKYTSIFYDIFHVCLCIIINNSTVILISLQNAFRHKRIF